MATKRFDLHMHSLRSDGKFPVDDVLRAAADGGLDGIALTDHDAVSVTAPMTVRTARGSVEVLPGAELSGMLDGREYHFLVYFPGAVPPDFVRWCEDRVAARRNRFEKARQRLGLPGVDAGPEVSLTRHHLARALVRVGRAAHLDDAFNRFLNYRHGLVDPLEVPYTEAIAVARAAGAVVIWAHPPFHELHALLPRILDAGVQGLEAYRPNHDHTIRHAIKRLAREHGLLLTGGSDWHGWSEGPLGLFSVYRPEVGDFLTRVEWESADFVG